MKIRTEHRRTHSEDNLLWTDQRMAGGIVIGRQGSIAPVMNFDYDAIEAFKLPKADKLKKNKK